MYRNLNNFDLYIIDPDLEAFVMFLKKEFGDIFLEGKVHRDIQFYKTNNRRQSYFNSIEDRTNLLTKNQSLGHFDLRSDFDSPSHSLRLVFLICENLI